MFKKILWLFLAFSVLSGSLFAKNSKVAEKPSLLVYCGITMVKPILEIAKIIEKKHNCKIIVTQGGSQDLYDSLKYSKKGDLYLPGSDSYIKKNKKDGFFQDSVYIGFNKAAIFVQKGNPKNIKGLESLVDEDISTILCNPGSGSIGKTSVKVISKFKDKEFFEDAFDMAVEIGTDSRNLNTALIQKRADMTINWRASAFWTENAPFIDVVEIDDKYAPKKKLVLNLLSFSKNPGIAKEFMKFVSSKEGKKIMKKYGFR